MKLWRISRFNNLEGGGGLVSSGRWHTVGRLIVYLAESPAAAMLERVVHMLEADGDLPKTYTMLEIEGEDSLAIEPLLTLADTQWRDRPEMTRAAGDEWLRSANSPLARVPSAIVPRTWNYLLNPQHPDAAKVRIVTQLDEIFDSRLFQSRPR